MTTTNFIPGTVIEAAWLNDVDDITYRKSAEWLSVKDPTYGAVGDGVADDTTAIQAAINTGLPIYFPPGVYKVTSTLTNTSDVIMFGQSGSVCQDYGNDGDIALTKGATIKYTGTTNIINFNADVSNRFSIQNLNFYVGTAYATTMIKLEGNKWFTGTNPSSQILVRDVSLYRDTDAPTPGSSAAIGIEFDLSDTTTPRCFFGAHVDNLFAYGLEEVYRVNIVNQTTPASGNWFNSNHVGKTHIYKCYRAANLIAGTTGEDQISANKFGPWFMQPAADNGGIFATGTLRLVNNVNRNTFDSIFIFDQSSGRRFIHTNPYSANNQTTWNKMLNCMEFEVDSSSPQLNNIEGIQQTWTPSVLFGGSATGVTYTVNTGRFVRQGVLALVEADITLNALGAAAGGAAVTISLPVEKASGAEAPVTLFITNAAGTFYGHAGTIGSGASTITLYKYATSGTPSVTAMTKADLQTGTTLRLSAVYSIRI